MFEKLINILETYGTDIRSTRSMISARKDVGDLALVFNILKFNDTFLVRIFLEDCAGDLTEIWEHDVLRSDEKQLYKIVEKMEKIFKAFECHVLENGSVNESVLFKNILDIVD